VASVDTAATYFGAQRAPAKSQYTHLVTADIPAPPNHIRAAAFDNFPKFRQCAMTRG
jgi:hypothetical protein